MKTTELLETLTALNPHDGRLARLVVTWLREWLKCRQETTSLNEGGGNDGQRARRYSPNHEVEVVCLLQYVVDQRTKKIHSTLASYRHGLTCQMTAYAVHHNRSWLGLKGNFGFQARIG